MPDGMSGYELARRIGSLRPEVPVLLASGYAAPRVIPELPTGELTLLKKPFNQADLSIAIRNFMAPATTASEIEANSTENPTSFSSRCIALSGRDSAPLVGMALTRILSAQAVRALRGVLPE
jgi:DNA-binding NtrC family response regulator